ncbi:MAG TPA: hypothetical protein VEY11_09865 [Pyrinomonadaceae bacterium]|nr:hypothetical protein [Pyrinomonadaceae bacterium]
MRRLALIYGILLTLTAGVWGSALAAASEWCMHAGSSAPAASDEHDCCRAKIGAPDAAHPAAHDDASGRASRDASTHDASTPDVSTHNASHVESNTLNQAAAHAGVNCVDADAAADAMPAIRAATASGLSCAECCAGNSGQTPATPLSVAPEQSKFKRAAESVRAGTYGFYAFSPSRISHLAPTQHAPPASTERRYILISVFLI